MPVLGVLATVVALAEPIQPLRALAATLVLLLLPGLALGHLVGLRDTWLLLLVAISSSSALTVLVSTLLMYAGIWSWQLTLALLGLVTVGAAVLTEVVSVRPPPDRGPR